MGWFSLRRVCGDLGLWRRGRRGHLCSRLSLNLELRRFLALTLEVVLGLELDFSVVDLVLMIMMMTLMVRDGLMVMMMIVELGLIKSEFERRVALS